MATYKRLNPEQLQEMHQRWQGTLAEWRDFAGQFGVNRPVRRGIARCHRQIRRIEAAARRRGVRL